jgi:hypothetical protein
MNTRRRVLGIAATGIGAAVLGTGQSPFVCNLKALTAEERKRYEQLSRVLAESMEEKRELPKGYAFRLGKSVSMREAAEWAEYEAKCCPFFDFRLERRREGGPLWLHLTGRTGVKQFIREEFGF